MFRISIKLVEYETNINSSRVCVYCVHRVHCTQSCHAVCVMPRSFNVIGVIDVSRAVSYQRIFDNTDLKSRSFISRQMLSLMLNYLIKCILFFRGVLITSNSVTQTDYKDARFLILCEIIFNINKTTHVK